MTMHEHPLEPKDISELLPLFDITLPGEVLGDLQLKQAQEDLRVMQAADAVRRVHQNLFGISYFPVESVGDLSPKEKKDHNYFSVHQLAHAVVSAFGVGYGSEQEVEAPLVRAKLPEQSYTKTEKKRRDSFRGYNSKWKLNAKKPRRSDPNYVEQQRESDAATQYRRDEVSANAWSKALVRANLNEGIGYHFGPTDGAFGNFPAEELDIAVLYLDRPPRAMSEEKVAELAALRHPESEAQRYYKLADALAASGHGAPVDAKLLALESNGSYGKMPESFDRGDGVNVRHVSIEEGLAGYHDRESADRGALVRELGPDATLAMMFASGDLLPEDFMGERTFVRWGKIKPTNGDLEQHLHKLREVIYHQL